MRRYGNEDDELAPWARTALRTERRAALGPLFDAEAEAEVRDAILAGHVARQGELLAWLRAELQLLITERRAAGQPGTVTADDAHAILERRGLRLEDGKANWLGALFRAPGWVALETTVKSRRVGRHASRLMVWTYDFPEAS